MSTIGEVRKNFNSLVTAIKNNDVAVMECTDTRTNEKVAIICAVNFDPDTEMFSFVPFAQMLKGNPYEYLTPPEDEAQ
jgi:hypothetical protein